MSVVAARSTLAKPDVPDLLARARTIAELARERAQQTETDRRVGEDMIARMREMDLFRIMQPQAYGGFEYGFDVFSQVVATIATGCGSTGWVYGLLPRTSGLSPAFHARPRTRCGRIATHSPPAAMPRSDGRWQWTAATCSPGTGSFCSGCDNAQWQLLGGMIPQPDGAVKPGFFLLRSVDCTIDDNWHTMGLAGTGSKTIVARDAFVPAHRVVPFAALSDATAPGMLANPNPIFRQSFLAVLPIAIVSPVLGMAEGALADFLAMAGMRTTRGAVAGGNRRMAELTTVQMRVAEASALIDAARLLMARDLAEALASATRGEPISIEVRLRNRRDQAFCVRLLVQAIDALFLAAGGQGLFLDQSLQRSWRDAHAAASHISLNWDSTGSMYGQHMLGLEPKGQY